MIKIIAKLLIIVFAIFVVAKYVPGVEISGFYAAFMTALILGVLNVIVRPILIILTLPITIITLGMFTFVINGILFWFIASFVDGFVVTGFLPAILGAFVVSVFSWFGNRILS